MSGNRSSSGVGGVIVFVIVAIAIITAIPPEVWIILGLVVAAAGAFWISRAIDAAAKKRRAAEAAAEQRQWEERVRQERQWRIDTLGQQNAELVESALNAVQWVAASEAARAGWLGDVDFSADFQWITDNLAKAYSLRGVASELSGLDNPSTDDRKILTEASATIAELERVAFQRLELIGKCVMEAQLVDESLRTEREDAQVAEQRAELHAKLSAMLYGIEAAPDTTPTDSTLDAVMARVQAFREIKNQIDQARGSGS